LTERVAHVIGVRATGSVCCGAVDGSGVCASRVIKRCGWGGETG